LDFSNNEVQYFTSKFPEYNFLSSNFISKFSLGEESLLIFDDSRNITLSYKDRASILVALKAVQLGIEEISVASTGNAGSSLAGVCARMNLRSHIFVPKNIPKNKLAQIQAFGSNLYLLDGDYDNAFDLCMEVSQKKNWYNRNTGLNPLTIEGKKSSVYDMFIELKGELPENIFVSAGDGVISSGIYKGLYELAELGWINKLPRIFLVQSEGSDAIIRYLETKSFKYKHAYTIADSICAGAPRNLYMAAEGIEKSGGCGIRVSDDEILTAQKQLVMKGIFAEPAAAAPLAGYLKLKTESNIDLTNSILMITGNGLKDISSLEKWIEKPHVKGYREIIETLS
jgi:threonine synthase